MRSAVDFLPCVMTRLISCVTSWLSKTGSAMIGRGVISARRGTSSSPSWLLHASAADEHDRVLLEVVTLTGDIGADLGAVRQPDAGDLAQRRVRLLGRH